MSASSEPAAPATLDAPAELDGPFGDLLAAARRKLDRAGPERRAKVFAATTLLAGRLHREKRLDQDVVVDALFRLAREFKITSPAYRAARDDLTAQGKAHPVKWPQPKAQPNAAGPWQPHPWAPTRHANGTVPTELLEKSS